MINVKFIGSIMKQGILRKPGDEMELPETAAALLAEQGIVEIPGKRVIRVKEEVDVVKIIDDIK